MREHKSIELDIDVNITVEFDFKNGKESYYDKSFGNWLPGESSEITNLKVFLVRLGKSVEITSFLDRDKIAIIETECWDIV